MTGREAPVLVVGGGIGGLATALALSQKGIAVEVLEQAPEFKEIGAGIQLGPNVFRMFEVLGLTAEMFRWCAFPEDLEFRDSITAETIVEMRLDKRFHDKYRAPYGVIHRADMLNVIYGACRQSKLIKLATSQKVVSIDDDGSGVIARTAEGGVFRGAALVGCDGLWSTVREAVVGDGKPVVSGHIAYRAVLPTAQWPAEYRLPKMIVWCGEKTHLVHYPLRRGELFNLVVVFHSNRYEEGWDSYGDPAELHERFIDKCEPVRTLLGKVNAWKMWVLCDRPPIKHWSKGRITLLGDAAHPMLQYLAQGGNMAMEDAVCLANQLEASGGDYAAAFANYQALRYLRTARVQLMARVFGEIYHASGVNRELRNTLLREWSREGSIDMSWLYGEQPELPRVGNIPMPPPTSLFLTMTNSLERTYDGIIIGAGHHGLILGSYLAKAGLDILLVDRRLQYGGGLSTEEATVPGFYHNLHSINHFHISETPWFKDLNLADRVTYITPRYELGQPHLDGTALVFGRDLEETLANVARFSRKDAATFREWNRRAEEITRSIFLPERYSEPLPQAEREAILSASALGREFLAITRRQPFEVVKELFENEHVQLLFLFKVSLFGTWLVDTLSGTSPMGSVIRAFDLQSGYQLCQGGSFNLARGLMETFIGAGGSYQPQVHIDRILIEGGKATGIVLSDARSLRARQFVASTLDVHQTFEKLVGREQLPSTFAQKIDKFQYTKWSLFGLHLAMHEPARLVSEAFDPNIRRTLKWSLGAETMDDLISAHNDVVAGRVPAIVQFGAGPLSVLDPTQAPPGKHTQYAWHVMPLDPDIGDRDYETFKEEFADKIIEVFARYAPNMTRRNIIAQYVYTGREYVARFPQMRGGDIFMGAFNAEQVMYNHFGYRTPIARLYMAGSSGHPGGAISGGAGYISAGIIARDLGVRTWWQPWNAGAALSAIFKAA